MNARRVVGTTALGAAMATGGCRATEVPNVAGLEERSERIVVPYRADRSTSMFRRADGVFDVGDHRVLVRWLAEHDEAQFDQYDVIIEERGRRLVSLRCGNLADCLLSSPGSCSYILRCRDEEHGAELLVEESFVGRLGKSPLYKGPLFYMKVADGCFAGVGMARDCESLSNPLIIAARHCPDDLREFNLWTQKKPVVAGRIEAASVIAWDKAKLFVPSNQPARDFVVSSIILLLSYAQLDRPSGTLAGIPSCE
jgi:hypothetical protein